jgi:hypothetical protein
VTEAKLLSLPFDQYQRYRLVADILEEVRRDGAQMTVLDVGGRTALLRLFLPDDHVYIVDLEPSSEQGLVLGDGSALPFADASVDAVVTFDTLEHVPPSRREAFVAECSRVARRWVVIAGPYATEGVVEAEQLLESFLREKLGIEHRYLAEHHRNGLPDLPATETALMAAGGEVRTVGHANLERWLPLMCLSMYIDRDAPLRAIGSRFFNFYNQALYRSDHSKPVYRHAVIGALAGAPLPADDVLPEVPVAPPGALEPVSHLIRELLAFDLERDAVKVEWTRLKEVNRGLHLDLEGHQDTLKHVESIREEQTGVIEELRLESAALRSEEEELEAEMEREREESTEVITTLETDLLEHRTSLSVLEEDLEGHRKELLSGKEREEEISAELERLRDLLTSERVQFEKVHETLEEDLEGHRKELLSGQEREEEVSAELERFRDLLTAERVQFEKVHETLEEDLQGHREQARADRLREEELVAEIAQLMELLQNERAGFEKVRGNLEQELTHLLGTVSQLRGEVESRGEELEELRGEAEQALIEADARKQAREVELQAELHGLRLELGQERDQVASLRALLADPWRNLKRAVRFKRTRQTFGEPPA